MNLHPCVGQYLTYCLRGGITQVRTSLRQAVKKLREHLVCCNQKYVSKGRPGANCLSAVLVLPVKGRSPVECVRENHLHFFFGAPWR
jgi:hypothetical protein